jgi:hypothetical protein
MSEEWATLKRLPMDEAMVATLVTKQVFTKKI